MKFFLEDTNTLNISEIDIGFIVQTAKMHFVTDILFEFKSHRRQELAKNFNKLNGLSDTMGKRVKEDAKWEETVRCSIFYSWKCDVCVQVLEAFQGIPAKVYAHPVCL